MLTWFQLHQKARTNQWVHSNLTLFSKVKRKNIAATEALDQYFTKKSVVEEIVLPIFKKYLQPGSVFIDTSAGTNYLGNRLQELGYRVLAFEIDPTIKREEPNLVPVTTANWLDVKKDQVVEGAAVGLNPPYGYQASKARAFILHAIKIVKPKFMIWIVPNFPQDWQPPNYALVEQIRMPKNSFYRPETGLEFDYPTKLKVYRYDPAGYESQQAAREEAAKTPEGFSYSPFKSEKKSLLTLEKDQSSVYVRKAGVLSGLKSYVWEGDKLFEFTVSGDSANKREVKETDKPKILYIFFNNVLRIKLPPRWSNSARYSFLKRLAPIALEIRAEYTDKKTLNQFDFSTAIRRIERETAVIDID